MDYGRFADMTQDIMNSRCVYLYGQGEARGNCYNMQRELKYMNVSVLILDGRLQEDVMFEAQDLLIVCSTSGQLFEYNRRRVRKLK